MFKDMSIGRRIMLIVGLASAVIIAVLTTINASKMTQLTRDAEERELRGQYAVFNKTIGAEGRISEILSAFVASIPAIPEAMAANDRARLMELLGPAFQKVNQEYGAVQFQFHTPPATSFLRVHQPDAQGDDLSSFRHTVVAVNRTRRAAHGLESGVAGLGIRGVVPIFHQSQHLGSVEFGMSFGQPFFDAFEAQQKVNVALHIMENGLFKTFASTIGNKPLLSEEELNQAMKGQEVISRLEASGRPLAVYGMAIQDFSGAPLGVVELAMDRSHYQAAIASARNTAIGVGFITLIIALGGTLLLSRNIAKPLELAMNTLNELAEGNLNINATKAGNDEAGRMLQAIGHMAERLADDMRNISQSARSLNKEANGLAESAESNSSEVKRQEKQVEQLAATINEMAASVQEVANSAALAADATVRANKEAEHGRQVVNGTVTAITALATEVTHVTEVVQHLAENSQSIGTVVDVINDIADQTNLLALNAAIEAARAGDQGRGFAVVADEVRTLAQRTQESTREIQQIVERLQKDAMQAVDAMAGGRAKVNESVKQAEAAGELLTAISTSVATITDMNNQIASTAEEQSAVTEEINRNIIAISAAARQNALSTDNTAKSSDRLAELSTHFEKVMNRFKY